MLKLKELVTKLNFYNYYNFYNFKNQLYSEQCSQAFVNSRESHKCHSKQTCCYKGDRHSLHTFRNINQTELFANSCKHDKRKRKSRFCMSALKRATMASGNGRLSSNEGSLTGRGVYFLFRLLDRGM